MSIVQLSSCLVGALVASSEAPTGSAALVTPDFAITISTWITFFLLLFFLGRYGWKPFVKALDEREASVAEHVRRAESARRDAELLLISYEEKLKKAQAEADAILSESRVRAEEISTRLQNEARLESQQIIEKARMTIEGERQKAVTELKNIVSDAASRLAGKILREEIDPKKHEKLIDEVILGMDKDARR